MGWRNDLEGRKAQVSHFNKMLTQLDTEMLSLSREQTRHATESRLQTQKIEFDRIGGDVVKALEKVESATFQTLANSSTEVLNQLEGVGTALVTATSNLNKAWAKHCDEEREFYQDRAFMRRVVIRRTRQEIWEEKCRVIDGDDFIKDQDITDGAGDRRHVESTSRPIDKDDERTLTPPVAKSLNNPTGAKESTPAPESPRSVEILSDISVEIPRLEADHEAAAEDLKAEQRANAVTAAQILDLQGQIGLLDQTLAMTNKELQQLKAEKARATSGKRRQTKSESNVSEVTARNKPVSRDVTAENLYSEEGYVVIESKLNELEAVAEELKKEKEAHATTAAKLTEIQEQLNPRGSFESPGDIKKYMMKLKALKSGGNGIQLQISLDESVKALETEKQEHAVTIAKLKELEEETKLKEPLVEVGQRVRRKFLENSKRVFVNGSIVDVRGEADLAVIKAGGEAAYQGNAHADASLFLLGFLDQEKDKALFEDLYACPVLSPPSRALQFPKLTELFNMRATMGYCSSFTQFTLSEEEDSRFQTLEGEYISILTELRKDMATVDNTIKEEFDSHIGVEVRLVEMRAIVDRILQLERRRNYVSNWT